MADHFLEVYDTGKNSKVVVLVSNYHAMRNPNIIKGIDTCCKTADVNIMVDILDKKIGKDIYNVCFLNGGGSLGMNLYFQRFHSWEYPVPPTPSLESYIKENTKEEYYFMDLQSSPLKDSSFYMQAVFSRYLKSKWADNYSGFFFIRRMKPPVLKNPAIEKGTIFGREPSEN